MKVSLEKDTDRAEIVHFARSFSGTTFFHTPTWMDVLAVSFPHFRPRWITARDGATLIGYMPLVEIRKGFFNSRYALPFGTYGDPLAHDQAVWRAILDVFIAYAGAATCLEAVATLFHADCSISVPAGVDMIPNECRLIRLEGGFEEYRRRSMSPKRRQLYNKSRRAGVDIKQLDSEREVREFYRLYAAGSRQWGGVHPYPLRMFLELFERRGEGVIMWGGFLRERLIGGHIDLYFGEMAQAWQAGMSPDSHQYGVGALLVTHAVREACRRGVRIFNLGSSGGNAGLIFFKESMGGREHCFPVIRVRKRWWRWIRRR